MQMRSRAVWLVMVLLVAGVLLAAGCTCGRRQQQNPFGQAGKGAGALNPANLDPETKKVCAPVCKTLCQRARECKVPTLSKPGVCGKACWFLCAKGIMDDEMRKCVTPESDCAQVMSCATRLGDKVKAARANLMGKGVAPTANPPAAEPAPAAPAGEAATE
jgi:hypothetical protein